MDVKPPAPEPNRKTSREDSNILRRKKRPGAYPIPKILRNRFKRHGFSNCISTVLSYAAGLVTNVQELALRSNTLHVDVDAAVETPAASLNCGRAIDESLLSSLETADGQSIASASVRSSFATVELSAWLRTQTCRRKSGFPLLMPGVLPCLLDWCARTATPFKLWLSLRTFLKLRFQRDHVANDVWFSCLLSACPTAASQLQPMVAEARHYTLIACHCRPTTWLGS